MPLLKSKRVDALGGAIEPDRIYTPVTPFAGPLDGVAIGGAWNPGLTRLRGDHPAVQKFPRQWVPDGTDSVITNGLRAQRLYGDAKT